MDFTGERFIPNAGLDGELEIEHYQRYQAITDLIADKVVLDAASGEGYGSALLAGGARQVSGLEIDLQAVSEAQRKYRRSNLSFVQGTIAALPFRPARFDAAVSFETIEHVPADLQEAFLREIKRVLKPEGFFLVSTPDKRIYSDLAHYRNKFHVHEFYRKEFSDFLSRYFRHITFWEQTAMLAYLLTDGNEGGSHRLFAQSEVQGKYIVALCSDSALPKAQLGSIVLDTEDRYRRSVERVIELQNEIEDKNKHIQIVLRDIDLCETTIRQQQHALKENALRAEERITDLHNELAQQQQRAAKQGNALAAISARLNHIETTKAWRLVKALYRLKDTFSPGRR